MRGGGDPNDSALAGCLPAMETGNNQCDANGCMGRKTEKKIWHVGSRAPVVGRSRIVQADRWQRSNALCSVRQMAER